jgi:hypothetical protein
MKSKTAKSAVLSLRCAYRTADGRQCRLFVTDAHAVLCPQHRAQQEHQDAADHYQHLTTNFQYFQTAQGINHSLMNLYQLLAQNRISPRRAAVLSYISSLLLRTLPQIDADRAAGIIDPTKPIPVNVLAPDKNANTKVDDEDSATNPHPGHGPVDSWDQSIAQPDPRKKPS